MVFPPFLFVKVVVSMRFRTALDVKAVDIQHSVGQLYRAVL